jgi:hypothetical protein
MRINELIKLLETYPDDLQVVYHLWSEQKLLKESDINIEELCHPRQDDWVPNKRPDRDTKTYLVIG